MEKSRGPPEPNEAAYLGKLVTGLRRRGTDGSSLTPQVAPPMLASMATITFDTLKLVEKLRSAGFAQDQAEAIVRVIADAQDEVVSKGYLDNSLEKAINPLRTDLAVMKWMLGAIVVAEVGPLVAKLFQ
jgi:hypothetical protein